MKKRKKLRKKKIEIKDIESLPRDKYDNIKENVFVYFDCYQISFLGYNKKS